MVLPGIPSLLDKLNYLRYRAFKDAKLLDNRLAWSIGVTCPGYRLFDFDLILQYV
jgi:hypothetical protein